MCVTSKIEMEWGFRLAPSVCDILDRLALARPGPPSAGSARSARAAGEASLCPAGLRSGRSRLETNRRRRPPWRRAKGVVGGLMGNTG